MILATVIYKDGRTEEKQFHSMNDFARFVDKNRKIIRYTESNNAHPTKKEQGLKDT